MRGAWLACLVGTLALLVHLGVARIRFRHFPKLTQLSASFLAAVTLVTITSGMWPVLADPTVENITLTDDTLTAMWLGYVAAVSVAAVYVWETGKALVETKKKLLPPPEKEDRGEPGDG